MWERSGDRPDGGGTAGADQVLVHQDIGLTTVEMNVRAQTAGTTLVRITEAGFTGDGDELVNQVTGS